MSTETLHRCDKCQTAIVANRSKLSVETGPLRETRRSIDLCAACCEAFRDWLASGSTNATDA